MGFIVIIFLSYITYADPTQKSKGTVSDLANGLYWGVVSIFFYSRTTVQSERLVTRCMCLLLYLCRASYSSICHMPPPLISALQRDAHSGETGGIFIRVLNFNFVYSRVPNNRPPPRFLIFEKFSNAPALIPTPPPFYYFLEK